MKLARLGSVGHERPYVIHNESFFDISAVVPDLDAKNLTPTGLSSIQHALDSGLLLVDHDAASLRVGSPIARPGAVVCIGMNYAAHAAESGAAPPDVPIMFLKPPNTVVGPNDTLSLPRKSTRTDWEVELAVVIGSPALYLESTSDASDCIAGYLTANDVSERTFQIEESGGQWSKGKSAPGFTPLGPWLVTADEIDVKSLRLRSWVNGMERQDSSTADMIFDPSYLVWHLSQYMQLDPGDVVLTGTPQGVALSGRFPYLAAGDVVVVEIEGLGAQRQVVKSHFPTKEHK